MKKSELKNIIKEEIGNIFEENKEFEKDMLNLDILNGGITSYTGDDVEIVYNKKSDNLYECEFMSNIKFTIEKDDSTSMIFITPLDSRSRDYFTGYWNFINTHGGTKFVVYKQNKMISKSVKNFVKYILLMKQFCDI